jgi:membrane-associated phospholipid phosphatase
MESGEALMTQLLAACGLFSVVLAASLICARTDPATAEPFPTRIEARVAPVSEASVPPLGGSFRTTTGKHPRFFLEGDGWVPYAMGAGLLLATDTVTLPFLQKALGGSTTRDVSRSVSYLGTPVVYMGTPLALYAFGGAHEKQAAAKMANALITSGILTQLVKMAAGRRRPNQSNGIGHFEGPGSDFESFPSGHTSAAFAMATVLSSEYPRYKVPLFVLATAVAASRVFQNKHFPSDVVVGAGIGLLAGNQAVRGGPNLLGFRF